MPEHILQNVYLISDSAAPGYQVTRRNVPLARHAAYDYNCLGNACNVVKKISQVQCGWP